MMRTFELGEDDAFRTHLRGRKVVVLFRGVGCPYSATFERLFREIAVPVGWEACLRHVEEGGRGPVAESLRVDITPTVAAFDDGRETARLGGRLLIGITRTRYQKWLRAQP